MFHPSSLAILMFVPSFYQYFHYAITRPKEEREPVCYGFGIAYISFGVLSLVSRDAILAFVGLYLIMLGMYMLAKGLERKDRNIFIDRFHEDHKKL